MKIVCNKQRTQLHRLDFFCKMINYLIYYDMYYALTALALENKFETSKHGQLIGWFNKEFISSNQIDSRFGKILRNAFQNRTKGDYDAFIIFSEKEVKLMLDEMVLFIQEIRKFLNR